MQRHTTIRWCIINKLLLLGKRAGLLAVALSALIACLPILPDSAGNPEKPFIATLEASGGKVYYVSPTGSDTNPGTITKPWKTIQKAANTMVAGDSTTVLAGNYNERVKVTNSGTAGMPIAYWAQGTVTMNGFTVRANYISLKGFDISNTGTFSGDGWGPDQWGIYLEGKNCMIENNYVHYATRGGIVLRATITNEAMTSNCVVRNNRLYRNSQVGIEVYGTSHLIEGNEIWGTIQYHPLWSNPPTWVDADGMRFFGGGHTFRRNYIHDISYRDPENVNPHIDCFQTWSDTDHLAGHDIVFEENFCKNLEVKDAQAFGKGFMLWGASNLIIRNNIIQSFCGINAQSSQNLTIVNNTFASDLSFPPDYGPVGVNLKQTPNSVVKNSIFYDFRSYSINVDDSISQQGADIGYNMMYRSDARSPSGSYYPTDLWRVNPMFVNLTSGDFHLQPSSPAVDAGISLAIVTNDFDGTLRPQGARYDIGAYELLVSRTTTSLVYLPLLRLP